MYRAFNDGPDKSTECLFLSAWPKGSTILLLGAPQGASSWKIPWPVAKE
jgi:hypothetical protein